MKWKLYECLTDEFGAVKKGEKIMVNGKSAQRLNGETLSIDTNYIFDHSDPDGDIYDFAYAGEFDSNPSKGPEKTEEAVTEQTPEKHQPTKEAKGQFFIIAGETAFDLFDSLEEARTKAETLDDKIITVAEIKGVLKITSAWV